VLSNAIALASFSATSIKQIHQLKPNIKANKGKKDHQRAGPTKIA